MNCTANQMTLGVLGPMAYRLGLVDSIECCMFGTIFGSLCTGYISTFGPKSGLRTLNVAKYTMGWYPSKLCVISNLVIEVGYGLIDCIVGGLLLSAVNGGGMSVVVGIVIVAIITWVVATFGITWFHRFEQQNRRFVWAPTVLVLFVLIGVAGPHLDTQTPSSGSGAVLAGNRLSYVFLTASGPLGWSPASADCIIYYPARSNRWINLAMTAGGITCGKLLIEFLGIGLEPGLLSNPNWAVAFDEKGIGALIVESYAPLNNFGKFCCVVLALCISANNIPGTYAASLNWQQLGRSLDKVPRFSWSIFTCVVFTIIAIAGREYPFDIFINFLSIIGYWAMIWITMTFEDEFLFRQGRFDWEVWNRRDLLPYGYAALFAFLVGWAGVVLCMYQTYYTGPIAAMIRDGSDIGLPVSFAWTAVVYPRARWLELNIRNAVNFGVTGKPCRIALHTSRRRDWRRLTAARISASLRASLRLPNPSVSELSMFIHTSKGRYTGTISSDEELKAGEAGLYR
ncbi:hypothetical protein K458DRAFT_490828 [Lentithecium fluviatile CBS 122367]|uniref:Purine-cytosine permease n=1 Tax=Lentithecium fluviatile CBS 122367 TaxID=1168545 RepID=A0A6G1IM48_9PLEO|nr:hypothetical protein K458DRAFT_490828 [Lentithecium fluviatile CBS 122367]